MVVGRQSCVIPSLLHPTISKAVTPELPARQSHDSTDRLYLLVAGDLQKYSTLVAVEGDCSQGKMAGDQDCTPEDILALVQEMEGKAGWHRSPRSVV